MKRDMDLVREILLAIEAGAGGYAPNKLDIDGHFEEEIGYHVYIMMEAGLLEGADTTHMGSRSPQALPTRLTWQGHERLEAAIIGVLDEGCTPLRLQVQD